MLFYELLSQRCVSEQKHPKIFVNKHELSVTSNDDDSLNNDLNMSNSSVLKNLTHSAKGAGKRQASNLSIETFCKKSKHDDSTSNESNKENHSIELENRSSDLKNSSSAKIIEIDVNDLSFNDENGLATTESTDPSAHPTSAQPKSNFNTNILGFKPMIQCMKSNYPYDTSSKICFSCFKTINTNENFIECSKCKKSWDNNCYQGLKHPMGSKKEVSLSFLCKFCISSNVLFKES